SPTGAQAPASEPVSSSGARAPTRSASPRAGGEETTVVVESPLYRVEFSSRGGVVKSWQLNNYKDDNKPQRVLDVVHPLSSEQTGGWPFALVLDEAETPRTVNPALYVVDAAGQPGCAGGDSSKARATAVGSGNHFEAPAAFCFSWSDGRVEVNKRFSFDNSYVLRAEVSVQVQGKPVAAGLGWPRGFGGFTGAHPEPGGTGEGSYTQ